MSIIQNQISLELHNLMTEKGVDLNSLVILSGVSQKTIEKILNSKKFPSISTLKKLCNVFCISTCEFFDIVINNNELKSQIIA